MYYSDLNYDSYDDYLQGIGGNDWQEIKKLWYTIGGGVRCHTCHSEQLLLVHKRSYAHLDKAFFAELYRRKKYRLMKKILSDQCQRCNKLLHFYDKKLHKKVELDYLFLTERERVIYWRIDMVIRRTVRTIRRLVTGLWMDVSVSNKRSKKRRQLAYLSP